jgi:hypothetical protein
LELSIDYSKLVSKTVAAVSQGVVNNISNPQKNPLATSGQWIGGKLYDITHD